MTSGVFRIRVDRWLQVVGEREEIDEKELTIEFETSLYSIKVF